MLKNAVKTNKSFYIASTHMTTGSGELRKNLKILPLVSFLSEDGLLKDLALT